MRVNAFFGATLPAIILLSGALGQLPYVTHSLESLVVLKLAIMLPALIMLLGVRSGWTRTYIGAQMGVSVGQIIIFIGYLSVAMLSPQSAPEIKIVGLLTIFIAAPMFIVAALMQGLKNWLHF